MRFMPSLSVSEPGGHWNRRSPDRSPVHRRDAPVELHEKLDVLFDPGDEGPVAPFELDNSDRSPEDGQDGPTHSGLAERGTAAWPLPVATPWRNAT